jgi:hypothetical protein
MKPINFQQLFQIQTNHHNNNNQEESTLISDLATLKEQYDADRTFYTSKLPTTGAMGALIGSIVTNLALEHSIVLTLLMGILSFLTMGFVICTLGSLKSNPFAFLFPALEKRKHHYLMMFSQLETMLSERERQYAILFSLREFIDSICGKIALHRVAIFETSYTSITELFEKKDYQNAAKGILEFYDNYQNYLSLFESQEKKSSFYQGLHDYFEQQRSQAMQPNPESLKKGLQATEVEQESNYETEKELQKVFTKII